jgi:hypothetical protein
MRSAAPPELVKSAQARAALVLHRSAPDPTRADSLVGILDHDSMPKHACNAAASETEQPIATLSYGVTAGVQHAYRCAGQPIAPHQDRTLWRECDAHTAAKRRIATCKTGLGTNA